MARHILIARRKSGMPSSWGRADWDGQKWFDAGEALEAGGGTAGFRATIVQTNLRALLDTAIGELGSANLTLAPRLLLDLITRGAPSSLNVPRAASVLVLCPVGRDGAEHTAQLWCPVMVSGGRCNALLDKSFVAKKLVETLKEIFTADDIKSRNSLHDLRELWVRHDLTAAKLCPDQITPYRAPVADPASEEAAATRTEREAAKAKHARTKAASRKSAEAGEHNKKAGVKFAEAQAKRRAKGVIG